MEINEMTPWFIQSVGTLPLSFKKMKAKSLNGFKFRYAPTEHPILNMVAGSPNTEDETKIKDTIKGINSIYSELKVGHTWAVSSFDTNPKVKELLTKEGYQPAIKMDCLAINLDRQWEAPSKY